MTATVHQFPRPVTSLDTLRQINDGTYATGGPINAYRVTHLSFDLEEGWSVELTRDDQSNSSPVQPQPVDVPADVRNALLQFLGVTSDRIPA